MFTHWTNSWTAFVESVVGFWNEGLSDQEVTDAYSNVTVSWQGRTANLFADGNIGVHMPRQEYRLDDGRYVIAASVVLRVNPNDWGQWRSVRVGDLIAFEMEIEAQDENPFAAAGIEWVRHQDNVGCLTICTRDGRLLQIL